MGLGQTRAVRPRRRAFHAALASRLCRLEGPHRERALVRPPRALRSAGAGARIHGGRARGHRRGCRQHDLQGQAGPRHDPARGEGGRAQLRGGGPQAGRHRLGEEGAAGQAGEDAVPAAAPGAGRRAGRARRLHPERQAGSRLRGGLPHPAIAVRPVQARMRALVGVQAVLRRRRRARGQDGHGGALRAAPHAPHGGVQAHVVAHPARVHSRRARAFQNRDDHDVRIRRREKA